MENYMVRIYRRDEEDPEKIAGILEAPGVEEKRVFKSFEELREIMGRRDKNQKTE